MTENKIKILFLDIDGVICTSRAHQAYGSGTIIQPWDPTCCQMIKRLCIANGYKIVCTSTWRFDPKVLDYFKKYDLLDLLYESWRTGGDRESRGEEIKDWMKYFNVSEYVIIDDDKDMLPDQLEHLIKTTFDDGFSAENLRKADELMGGKFKDKFFK